MDLVVDLSHAFKQLEFIEPWLQTSLGKPTKNEQLQSLKDRSKIDGLWECILCFSCTTSCVSYWWNGEKYLGPAVLLQASRRVNDSRVQERKNRLKEDYGNILLLGLIITLLYLSYKKHKWR